MLKKFSSQQRSAALLVFKTAQKQAPATVFIVQQRSYARQSKGSFMNSEYGAESNPHTSFPVAAVFGCTGFVGRAIVQELTTAGYQVITPYRGSEFKVQDHKVMGDVGQVVGMRFATDKYETILDICSRANIVVSSVGRAYPKWWDEDWQFSNVEVPKMIAKASKETNVDRFIQISHLGAHVEHPSKYLRVKAHAEAAVRQEFPDATILRPADAFGERDRLLTHIGRRLQSNRLLGVPVVDRGIAKLQPVFVSNIADAVVATLATTASVGQVYELGGPKVYKYHELIKYVADYIGARYSVTPLHILPATLMGLANEYRTNKATFTRDWAVRFSYDQLVSENAKTFDDLGIEPIPLEEAAFPLLRKFMKWQGHLIKDTYNYV